MTEYSYNADMTIALDGAQIECMARITFSHYAGYAGDRIDPPEPATVELSGVDVIMSGRGPFPLPTPLLDAFDKALQNEMFEFVAACREEAADARCRD